MSFDDLINREGDVTRAEFNRLLQRGMTHSQLTEFKKSEQYLMALFKKMFSSERTKSEEAQILNLLKRQAQEVWEIIFTGTLGETKDKFPEYSDEESRRYAFSIAETLMLNELYLPPHFTKCGRCLECGPVYLPERIESDVVGICPWCAVLMPSKFLKGEENYDQ